MVLYLANPGWLIIILLHKKNTASYSPFWVLDSVIIDSFAAGQGFEPRLPGPEPGVLPLDDPARFKIKNKLLENQDALKFKRHRQKTKEKRKEKGKT